MGSAVGRIYQTKDYDMFTSIDGNRRIRPTHFKRLKKSMQKQTLLSPITVNHNYQVIDGQHRLACLKSLDKPVHYYICEEYGLNEVHIMNSNMANWSTDEFMHAYADSGIEPYMIYRTFKEKWGFNHRVCLTLLRGRAVGKETGWEFNSGEYEVSHSDMVRADKWARKITRTGKYYHDFKRRSYIFALLRCFKNPEFHFDEFLNKLKLQPTKLVKCTAIDEYLVLIEKIYNFHRADKVRLY
jgi:hypothetical protein